jgi:hypothetical protein
MGSNEASSDGSQSWGWPSMAMIDGFMWEEIWYPYQRLVVLAE